MERIAHYQPLLRSLREGIKTVVDRSQLDWGSGVIVRSTNWLGDALMTRPAMYRLKCLLPEGLKLWVLCPENLVGMWLACPFVDGVIGMKDKHVSKEDVARVKETGAKVGVVFPNSFGSARDIHKCGLPVRCGRRGRWRSWLLTDVIAEWGRGENVGKCHQLSYYLDLVGMFGDVPLSSACPPLSVDSSLALSLGIDLESAPLVLAPGAAYGPAKQWPAADFISVGKWHESRGGQVVIVGGGKDIGIAGEIAGALAHPVNCCGKTTLPELMSVLARSCCVVANDSGTMHLGAAVGCRGIGLFASTDPVGTGPIGGDWTLLVSGAPCRPCFLRQCKRKTGCYACFEDLPAAIVIEQLAEIIGK